VTHDGDGEDETLDRDDEHGGDRERGAAAVEAHHAALSHAVTDAVTTETDAILCCVGLAGGSGATAVPPLAAELRRVVDRPIYGLGLLPAEELPPTVAVDADPADDRREAAERAGMDTSDPRGEDPPEWAVNAGRALEELTVATDSLLCFDTADWLRSGESIDEPTVRRRCNDDLARRVATLFRAGEVDPEGPIAERVVDAAELQNTFDAGGIATLGYASQTVERPQTSRFGLGLFEQAGEVETTASIKAVDTTVRRAVRGKLSVEVDRASTSRGLLIVGGPPAWLNREAVSSARKWLTEETASVQIRTGDMPTPEGSAVIAVVLLTGVGVCPRVDALRQCAEQARRRTR
jgi:cell division GTPase FtsZ